MARPRRRENHDAADAPEPPSGQVATVDLSGPPVVRVGDAEWIVGEGFGPRRINPKLAYEDVASPPRHVTGWTVDAGSAAIALAYHLGARDITVTGFDLGVYDAERCAGCGSGRGDPAWDVRTGAIFVLRRWIESNGGLVHG